MERRRWFLLAFVIVLIGGLGAPALASRQPRPPRPPRPPRTTTVQSTSTTVPPTTTTTQPTTTTTTRPPTTPTGDYQWSRSFGGDTWVDTITLGDVAVAPDGAAIVVGTLTRDVNIGGTALHADGSYDIFVARYLANGNLDWVRKYGGSTPDFEFGESVVVDAGGNAYVGGQFTNVATFGTKTLTSKTANSDAYIVKINTAGNVVWARNFGGDGGDSVAALATNGTKVASTGRWTDAGDDVMIAMFNNADGTDVYAPRHEGGPEGDLGKGIAIDAQGFATVTGFFTGRATIAGVTMNSAGLQDMFVARYDTSGTAVKAMRIGSTGIDMGTSIAPAGTDDVVVGQFAATVNFAGISKTAKGSADIFVARFDGNLDPRWVQQCGSDTGLAETVREVAVDGSGNAVFTGDIIAPVNFGNGALPAVGQGQDPFLAKIDADGKTVWSKRFTSTLAPYNRSSAVATGPGDDVVAVGAFMGDITIGGTEHTNKSDSDPLRKSPDGYIARFGP